jgi:hypothetical protein
VVDHDAGPLLQRAKGIIQFRRLERAAAERADRHRQGRELLAEIVVDVARDAGALQLLRADESSGQLANATVARAERRFALLHGERGAVPFPDRG